MSTRTPLQELQLTGSGNIKRALNRQPERTLAAGTPTAPDHLSPAERTHWDHVVKILSDRKTLTKGHGEIIEVYAKVKARYLQEAAALATEGTFTNVTRFDRNQNAIDMRVLNPRLKVVTTLERQLSTLTHNLGLATIRTTTPQISKVAANSAAAIFPDMFDWDEDGNPHPKNSEVKN